MFTYKDENIAVGPAGTIVQNNKPLYFVFELSNGEALNFPKEFLTAGEILDKYNVDIRPFTKPKVILDVVAERERQDRKWGEQNHNPSEWVGILTEEVGEFAREAVDFHHRNPDKDGKIDSITQSKRVANMKKELIQVAAVAVQAVESIERQGL